MADEDLRTLERDASKGDPLARYRWRTALIRAGRGDEAGVEVGDKLLVTEAGVTKYSDLPWTAEITHVSPWEKDVVEWRAKVVAGLESFKEPYKSDARYKDCVAVLPTDTFQLIEAGRPPETTTTVDIALVKAEPEDAQGAPTIAAVRSTAPPETVRSTPAPPAAKKGKKKKKKK